MRTRDILYGADWLVRCSLGTETGYYNQHPDEYERIMRVFYEREVIAKNVCKLLKQHSSSAITEIRDHACGTGIIADELANKTQARVVAHDISEAMMEYGQKTKNSRIVWKHSDLNEKFPDEDESIDAVTMICASRFIEDSTNFHRELSRVLKPSGIAILTYSDSYPKKRCEHRRAMTEEGFEIRHEEEFPKLKWMSQRNYELIMSLLRAIAPNIIPRLSVIGKNKVSN